MSSTLKAAIGFQILPQADQATAYGIVDKVLDLIKSKENVKYFVGPLETTIEGDLTDLLQIVDAAVRLAAAEGVPSIYALTKILVTPGLDSSRSLFDGVSGAMERHNC
jgi:uncharacterized protein YqgV (UPF0045/DUF77 family)